MAAPLPFAVEPLTLRTRDDVRLDAVLLTGDTEPDGLGLVVAHGFTGGWREPPVRRVAALLSQYGRVLSFDFRGHGRSGGASTVGDQEIWDVEAAVAHLRQRGCDRVATVGFSMGASVVVRHAGLVGGVVSAVSVSGPSRWYYRGTKPMRRVHWAIEQPIGRAVARYALRTRIAPRGWDPVPVPPFEAAALIAPTPFLVVHGDADPYFPTEHAHRLYAAAREPRELWLEPGFGHAEGAATAGLLHRIGGWVAAHAEATPTVA
jgi:pimeloyl-ACP methyl ester carboxylesterase